MNRALLIASLLAASTLASTGQARAMAPESTTPVERRQLVETITRARLERPRTFEALASLKRRVPELDRRKRGRFAVVSPMVRALGPEAVPALLDELSADRPMPVGSADSARVAFRVGLIEVAAESREPLAAPALRDIVQNPAEHPQVVRAAAAGLGTLDDEAGIALLLRLVGEPGPRQAAIAAGMGNLRRPDAVSALAGLLDGHPEPGLAEALVKALSAAANAWAWETPALAARPGAGEIRAEAARALLAAWRGYSGRVRTAAEKGLLAVDAPETAAMVAEALNRPASDAAELERLAARLASNPLRRSR